jgi:DNA repair protein RadC
MATAMNLSVWCTGRPAPLVEPGPLPISTAVREMPWQERPRERLEQVGAEALRDAELLAVLFRTGTREEGAVALAERLIRQFGDLRKLGHASLEELQQVRGVGRVKAVEIKAALELGRRAVEFSQPRRPRITRAEQAAEIFMGRFRACETEHFKALLLNTKNEVLKVVDITAGGVDFTLAAPMDVFRMAVRETAPQIMVAHNHPSGDPEPSRADLDLTARLKEAGNILGVRLLDHLIIGDKRFVSLAERGMV